MTRPLRYLWAFSAHNERWLAWHDRLLAERRAAGFDVEHFCVTPPELSRVWLRFPELDLRWKAADPALLRMYDALCERLRDRDVLILYNGANLHPQFVRWLPVLRVYTAGDDPESTEFLTRPAAPAFDVHLVNNVACVQMYRRWGLEHVHFWPLGSTVFPEDVADISEETILDSSQRTLPAVFFGERNEQKREALDRLQQAAPEALCAGRGWPRGFLPEAAMHAALRNARLGWNVHNSTGPINFRLYDLPAHGVLQLCDNRSHLGQVFELNREVVGFETIDECLELTRYYLAHPAEERRIALGGWQRWQRDYTPLAVWRKLTELAAPHVGGPLGDRNWEELARRLLAHRTGRTVVRWSARGQWKAQRAWASGKRWLRGVLGRG